MSYEATTCMHGVLSVLVFVTRKKRASEAENKMRENDNSLELQEGADSTSENLSQAS